MSWTPRDAVSYLRETGRIPSAADPDARSLGGGVSNHVIEVRWGPSSDDATDPGCLVLKRPLPNLDVEDDWPADVERVHNEAAAARAYREIIADAGLETVAAAPDVPFEDRETHTVGFDCAPADAAMWKRRLLDGHVDHAVAETVGRVLGAVHATAADRAALREEFGSERPFDQLRLDPYHRTVADRHPEIAAQIEREIDRIGDVRRTLVHGDYSPKNVLVGDRVWILDFEVAHWGDPAFDVAFMTNHLLIKAVHCSTTGVGAFETYVEAAERFRSAYEETVAANAPAAGGTPDIAPPDRAVAAELAILLLARMDGKSPVEYVDEPTAATLRSVSKGAIRDGVDTTDALIRRLREATA